MDLVVVVEIDSDQRISAVVVFDADDFEAAIAELDSRYLAAEAAPNGHTWSIIMQAYAALNRHELPPTTADWTDIDHRPLAPIGSGDLIAYLGRFVADLSELSAYAESVHRLTAFGAVVTHVAIGTSLEGFDAEWRMVYLVTLDGDMFSRGEIFEEADLEVALARRGARRRPRAAGRLRLISCRPAGRRPPAGNARCPRRPAARHRRARPRSCWRRCASRRA